jgi:hypothetical protein
LADEDVFWSWTLEEIERFTSKTTESLFGCIEWQGWRNEKGYGRMKIGGRVWFTHRIAWILANQRMLQPTDIVMHSCDNPRCCNPEHLIVGDIRTNNADRDQKGRRGRAARRRRLTADEVAVIKLRLKYDHSIYSIAMDYCCGETTIRHIRDGATWRDVKLPLRDKPEPYDPFADE